MATISIDNMSFYAYHGCFEEEQNIGTHFLVSVKFYTDTTLAERSDNVLDTVNYAEVYELVKKEMDITSHLLEHVARRIADRIKKNFPKTTNVHVKVEKLNPPIGGQVEKVAVEIAE